MHAIPAADTRGGTFQRIDRSLLTLSKPTLGALLLFAQVLLFYADFLTGPYIPFGVFYLLSLFVAVKYLGVRSAYVMAFIVVCGKSYVRINLLPAEVSWWQHLWQFISSYSIYTFFCYLINAQLSARLRAENVAVMANIRAGDAERKLVSISEETQQRIGRELHDDLGQHMTGIAFMAQVLTHKLRDAGRNETADAERITTMMNQAIIKIRNLAHGLYPSALDEPSLPDMLEKLASHVESVYPVRCSLLSDNKFQIEDHEVATHLFRIAQESVNNAVKHGQANCIDLRLSRMPTSQIMEISDNGCGVADGGVPDSGGLGMRSMRYRAELIGAVVKISSRSEGGTQVVIEIPYHRERHEI